LHQADEVGKRHFAVLEIQMFFNLPQQLRDPFLPRALQFALFLLLLAGNRLLPRHVHSKKMGAPFRKRPRTTLSCPKSISGPI
jgi:hypothetical protein